MSDTRHTFRNIPPDVILDAKIHALQTERTLGQMVADALTFLIAEETDPPEEGDQQAA